MLSLISGGVVVSAIAIVFGKRGVWAASLLFLIGLVMFPFAMIYFLGLSADAAREQAAIFYKAHPELAPKPTFTRDRVAR